MVNTSVERTLLSAALDFDVDLGSDLDLDFWMLILVLILTLPLPGMVGQGPPTHTKQPNKNKKGQSGAPETVLQTLPVRRAT
jgi:hypothetical protein